MTAHNQRAVVVSVIFGGTISQLNYTDREHKLHFYQRKLYESEYVDALDLSLTYLVKGFLKFITLCKWLWSMDGFYFLLLSNEFLLNSLNYIFFS